MHSIYNIRKNCIGMFKQNRYNTCQRFNRLNVDIYIKSRTGNKNTVISEARSIRTRDIYRH